MTRDRGKKRFRKSILDNGMVLVTESVPSFHSLAIGVWVRAGTRHESAHEAGLSHFLEHMMFKGTEKRSALDIAQQIDRVGGEFNAFTAREYTCFHVLLLARDYTLAVDILSDILHNSTFDEIEIERERKVILQEISMVEDNPEELAHDLFFEQAFGGHALGKPILGTRDTLKKFNRSTVYSYFRKHYAPGEIILSVAGDVDHFKVRDSLNKTLKPEYLRVKERRKHNMQRPRVRRGTQVIRRNLEQAHVLIGFPSVAYNHGDRFVAYLMSNYLGGGMSSTLFQEIREKRGLAYTIYSTNSAFSDSGVFSTYVATNSEGVKTCLDITAKQIEKLKNEKLDSKA
ncbi:MAG TPA: pitrilysin family protein, partial [Oligoflexia bacterium]|nr:pitrilysin family protein [Oligoflexia bacterium]